MALALVVALSATNVSFAQRDSRTTAGSSMMIGKESKESFDSANKNGALAVSAVSASNAPLSDADQKLMMQVAMGGMEQLEASKIAASKATSEEVRQLAQAEVEEQTGLAAKLKEISTAKNITLPADLDAAAQAKVSKMQGMSGADFDKMYVRETGVKGHEKLNKVMTEVESKATDTSLKSLAVAAHPLIRTHLKVSEEVMKEEKGGKRAQR